MAAIKVYEAKTLVSATEKRARQYEELKEQLNQLKKQFLDIVNSGDEFQGKGAEAIKGFYSAQVDVVEAWMRLIDKNIAFFKGIPGDAEDAKLSGDTFVQMSFIEENVPRAQNRAKEMVHSQQDALQSIFRSIDDLVPLHVFSTDTFEDHMAKAEKERSQTIDAVNQLDQALTEEYAISENDQSYLVGLFGQLLESSRQGSTITPINFDAKAYQNSEIYKMKKDIENSSKEYLSFKNDQAEARKQAKIAEELENRPWYEKLWDTTKTFTGEVSGYYDYKRATEGVDPITGEKLTDAQRIAAGAMAAAGFIPVVGWAGRAAKGGSAIYKTVKAYNAADHALDAYKTSKSFSTLQKTEMGIYGLVSANGLGEAVLGKDMFGNQLTDQQRQQSLMQALGILGVGGAAYGLDKLAAKNGGLLKGPYSNKFVNKQIENANAILTNIGKRVGNFQVPVRIKGEAIATNTGINMNVFNVETKALRDVMMQAKSVKMKEGVTDKKYAHTERKISDDLYRKLRKKTPTEEIRDMVNKDVELPMPDPAIPGKMITTRLEADHIVSMDIISKLNGFDNLSYNQQLEVLNNIENFIGLSKTANTSKGSKSYSEWTIYKKENIEIDPIFREKMMKKEIELEIKLQKQIDEFLKDDS
ncbi:ribonuclease YeeF family protein [Peribacillus frigoritolerans]|uniref:ribonuclease YeeF family protein n=1 Tax=Peribacillus frigoritolerans TaxID=450367 RepID=UPI00105A1BD0|nr:T7SS effector LXG polymorphic toxin [Peribacillus frigoritolerans]TDL77914.1 transposase [Peribacillus frigoritolerans]